MPEWESDDLETVVEARNLLKYDVELCELGDDASHVQNAIEELEHAILNNV